MNFLVRACLIAGIPVLATAWSTRLSAADDGAPAVAVSVKLTADASIGNRADSGADIRAEAVALHQARLAGTVSRLERELGSFPDDPDGIVAARRGSDAVAGLEVWDLNAERTMLRRRIDALRERITLFEQIDQRQDKLDRARLVEHQEAMVSLATDRAYAGKRKTETEIRLTSSEWTAARRQAKLEMLADVRRELDALVLPATPASATQVEIRVPITVEPAHVDSAKSDEVKTEAAPAPQAEQAPAAPVAEPVPAPQP